MTTKASSDRIARLRSTMRSLYAINTQVTKAELDKLTSSEESAELMNMALTSPSFDNTFNYETLEQMGDATLYKFIVWFSYTDKFKDYFSRPGSEAVVTQIKNYYTSGEHMAKLTQKLGFDGLMLMNEDEHSKMSTHETLRIAVLENAFESVIGALELNAIHVYESVGLAYQIIHDMLREMFADIKIDYDILVDDKSKINEVVSIYKLGQVKYHTDALPVAPGSKAIFKSVLKLKLTTTGETVTIGEGEDFTKKGAETRAAGKGLKYIEDTMGLVRQVPSRYLAK